MKYKVAIAFFCVTAIWSTTPLAIQWSSVGVGYLFAITSRMTVATIVCFILLRVLGMSFPWHKAAKLTYLAASIGVYLAMILVYWGSQFIPSGWVAVIFGASSMLTGLIAHRFLADSKLTRNKIVGSLIGLLGLIVIFWTRDEIELESLYGLSAMILSTLFHTLSAIAVKKVNAVISPLATTAGTLLFSLPAYLLTWWVLDGHLPTEFPPRAIMSIAYLGVIGSVIGFVLYYFVLNKLEASRVALITLITPVTALLLGHYLNGEVLTSKIWFGTLLIMFGLIIHEFTGKKLTEQAG